jgi:ElaB/YqjD/DUF883 family membrane-anchored ribosome-binding protein
MKTHFEAPTRETPEQLIEHISRLMAEAEAMLAGPVAANHDLGRLSEIKYRLESARARLREFYGRARTQVVAGARFTDDQIHEYPYYSMAIALGVGVLVGVLLGRSSNRW